MAKSVTRWLLHKFTDIDKERLSKHLDVLSKESGRSKPYILADMAVNFLRHGTGYTDYFRADFIHLTEAEKKTWCTAKKFYNVIHYLNDPAYIHVLHDKLEFNEVFRDYVRRDFINLNKATNQDFAAFLQGKTTVFAKDPTGECGHGITKYAVSDIADPAALYASLKENGQLLVEDAIVQCREMNEINPHVVNSFRVVTLYKDGKAQVIANGLRVNQDDTQVIGCTNDVYFSLGADGHITSNVIDDYGTVYDTHPLTGKKFSEVCIPGVDEAFRMCVEAAKKLPQVRYIGWDVAFSVKGPVMVEGNEYPGYGFLQFYKLTGSRTGHLKTIADVLGDEMNNIKL